MNKKQQQTELTKKKIADAARMLFMQKGYKATSIEDMVKATGYSGGNIYYHFKSKEGLFLHLIETWNKEWDANWLTKEHLYPTTIDKLYGMAEHLAIDYLNHPLSKAADEFFNMSEQPSEVEERINEIVNGYVVANQQLLQKGLESGEFEIMNVTGVAIILDSLMFGLSQHTRRMEREEALATYRLAVDVILYGIAKPSR